MSGDGWARAVLAPRWRQASACCDVREGRGPGGKGPCGPLLTHATSIQTLTCTADRVVHSVCPGQVGCEGSVGALTGSVAGMAGCVRKVKTTSGATGVQIVEKRGGVRRIVEHVGRLILRPSWLCCCRTKQANSSSEMTAPCAPRASPGPWSQKDSSSRPVEPVALAVWVALKRSLQALTGRSVPRSSSYRSG
jgi:hypothetical protein